VEIGREICTLVTVEIMRTASSGFEGARPPYGMPSLQVARRGAGRRDPSMLFLKALQYARF